ncbi:MAG: amidase family protein [Pseudohongiella sp.]|uniref:amidase n=1 Tax=Pseudohongiella sp. TaxID=1979412 RepID=UPI0034A02E7D
MLTIDEYTRLDAIAMAKLRQTGETSASELLECAFAQSDKLNPQLNAIVHQDREHARQLAQQMDTSTPEGLLAGVPFLIKEVNAVAGWPHTRSTAVYRQHVASSDSAIVRRYRDGGLIPFGSTNTPELCLTITTEFSVFGSSRNPHQLNHSSGGSSGGSAAAVAAGIVPVADGSDGGGSIRIPAACCGLVGLKPSRGLSVVEPDFGSAWSGMSVGHVLSRSVRDSAAFLDLLRLRKPGLFALPAFDESYYQTYLHEPKKLRIAVQRQHPAGLDVHQDCLHAVDFTARQCENAGHYVEEIAPPIDYTVAAKAMSTLINVHVGQILSTGLDISGRTLDQIDLAESTRRMAAHGINTPAAKYLAALDTIKQIEQQMATFHENHDLVLSPVLALPPAELGWLDMNAADIREYARRYAAYSPFTALYNGTGQPSISLPLHKNADGLPIGVMFSAAWGQDHVLLQLANQLLPDIVPIAR